MYVRREFYSAVLLQISAPPSNNNAAILATWQRFEGGQALFNPLNTTTPMPGSSRYNSAGVQNYPNEGSGETATARTLLNGHYPQIVDAFRADTPMAEWYGNDAIIAEINTWGTHGFAAMLSHEQPPVPPIPENSNDDEESDMQVKAQRADGTTDYFQLMPDGKIQHVYLGNPTYDDTLPGAIAGALIEAHWDAVGALHCRYHGWTGGPTDATRSGEDGNVCESVWTNGNWSQPLLMTNPA